MRALPVQSIQPRSGGFTLIELLTVIAVIGILAGLAFMGARSAMTKARQMQCVSNLRTIGQAINLFVLDNKGEYPRSSTNNNQGNYDWVYEGGFWFNALGPYLGGHAFQQVLVTPGPHPQDIPFACPAVPPGQHGWGDAGIDVAINGYQLPRGPHTDPRVRATSIKNPPLTFLVADSTGWVLSIPADGSTSASIPGFDFRHGDKANVLFFDGHVSPVSRQALQGNSTAIARLWGEK